MTDGSFNPLSGYRYNAWGKLRYTAGTPAGTDSFTYTGQRTDGYINLMYYGSRWYDPYLNRWTQPDPIIPDPNNPQDYDRYAYVRNNPVNYNDPTGHMRDSGCNLAGCSYIDPQNSFQTILNIVNSQNKTWDQLPPSYQQILINDEPGVTNAPWYEDPATYVSLVLGGLYGFGGPSLVPFVQAIIGGQAAECLTAGQCNDLINLYRAVGSGELSDILNNNIFRPDPNGMSMEGKWFTNSPELAAKWGQMFANWTGKAFSIVEIGVPQSIVDKMLSSPNLDGIGPAWYAEGKVLEALNQALQYINVLH